MKFKLHTCARACAHTQTHTYPQAGVRHGQHLGWPTFYWLTDRGSPLCSQKSSKVKYVLAQRMWKHRSVTSAIRYPPATAEILEELQKWQVSVAKVLYFQCKWKIVSVTIEAWLFSEKHDMAKANNNQKLLSEETLTKRNRFTKSVFLVGAMKLSFYDFTFFVLPHCFRICMRFRSAREVD